jgi:hypothetical protein
VKIKGLEIEREVFNAIISDHKWQHFLVFKDADVYVDLKKYSENKCYLPIDSEFQSYIVGFTFTKELYACPYRSQDDLVCIYPKRLEKKIPIIVKRKMPFLSPISLDEPSDSSLPPDIQVVEIEELIYEPAN